ncbi:GNAT family N-acetyltransferase [Undibacterium cyanobacteriorum]|uniref:GNAT family N-acetyltransferase n=1 Tax=Undibacterium cyanobacteriorum TaxID=3073561 RepID=A0ABY9RFK2_9BURK|nr:GNAT family N-acetyltransferase [Undibacterium sp. 20NA77.5]WMW78926.1 GNAT family N-acetyltransferase [Undibacterium sp. 20NA77.5]
MSSNPSRSKLSAAPRFRIELGEWSDLQEDAQSIRTEVFVFEQKIPAELEWDIMDVQCLHAVAYDEEDRPIGTGRLLPDGHMGRMAVLNRARNCGVGAAILRTLMDQAKMRGHTRVQLNAQTTAESFYLREGFEREGDIFLEAGIDHVHMSKGL